MNLKEELLELEKELTSQNTIDKKNATLLHVKAHLLHNKKMHTEAVNELEKYNIPHKYFDNLDNAYK